MIIEGGGVKGMGGGAKFLLSLTKTYKILAKVEEERDSSTAAKACLLYVKYFYGRDWCITYIE